LPGDHKNFLKLEEGNVRVKLEIEIEVYLFVYYLVKKNEETVY